MPFTLVQSAFPAFATTGTTVVGTYASNNTAGNHLFAVVSYRKNVGVPAFASIADTAGNVWEQIGVENNAATNLNVLAFQVPSCIAGANAVTATVDATVFERLGIGVVEVSSSGPRTSDDSDVSADAGADTTFTGPTVSAAKSGSLVIALIGEATGRGLTGDTGWTAGHALTTRNCNILYDLDAGAAGNYTPSGTWSGNETEVAFTLVLSELTGGNPARGLIGASAMSRNIRKRRFQ